MHGFLEGERSPGKRFGGLAFVILLHIFIVYALVSGLARNVVEIIKVPIETKLIEEIKPPPPPYKTKPENINLAVNTDGDIFWNEQFVPTTDA